MKPGMNVVYPGHGVGKITAIETREVLGSMHEFYCIQIYDTGMKIIVQVDNLENAGIREIMDKATAKKALAILQAQESKHEASESWNKTYRLYMEQIKTGLPLDLAEVVASLENKKARSEMSFGERKMLDSAKSMLFRELDLALPESKRATLLKLV